MGAPPVTTGGAQCSVAPDFRGVAVKPVGVLGPTALILALVVGWVSEYNAASAPASTRPATCTGFARPTVASAKAPVADVASRVTSVFTTTPLRVAALVS